MPSRAPPPRRLRAASAASRRRRHRATDIPVGGGRIFEAIKVVVTQPTEGDFKAFTAVCTHQACTVSSVKDGRSAARATAQLRQRDRRGARTARPPGRCRRERHGRGRTAHRRLSPARPRVGATAERDVGLAGGRPVDVPSRAGRRSRTDPGVYRFRDERRPGHLRRQGQEPAAAADLATSPTSPACTRAPDDGHHRRPASSGPSSAPRSRRCSWSTPGSRSSTRGSTSSTATTSATPSWR